MKIPIIWLQDYVKTDKSPAEIAASFTQLGLMLDKPLGDGKVLDLEHRMDRSDWLSILGCVRDYAAFENLVFTEPKLYSKAGKKSENIISITVECPEIVRRFNTRVFRGVKITRSPEWLTERLSAYGIPAVNNIVDITNFVMVEYGQPMHAQDIDKLPDPEIVLRHARNNEKIISFLGTELVLDESMFVLSSGGKPVVLGGIVGGSETGVSDSTVDFILDAGNYDQRNIRRTSRKLRITNETVLRYDKFLDPRLTEDALGRATELILQLAGGTYHENIDYYPQSTKSKNITLRLARLLQISGMNITLEDAKKTLTHLGYVVTDQTKGSLSLEIPYFRTDVEVEDDLVADVLRIGDYTNIPSAPMTTPVPTDITPPLYLFEDRLRDLLVAAGCHEHITGSLVPTGDTTNQIRLQNALTSEQSALRVSIEETLIAITEIYKKHGQSDINLFEIGKVYSKKGEKNTYDDYTEERRVTVLGHQHEQVRQLHATILKELGIPYRLDSEGSTASIISGHKKIGYVLPNAFTLFTEIVAPLAKPYGEVISEFTHPKSLDLSFANPKKVVFGEIHKTMLAASPALTSVISIEPDASRPLVRVTWTDSTDVSVEKNKIIIALTGLGLTSRSD